MKKRFLSIMLTLCMTLTMLPMDAWAAEEVFGTVGANTATSGTCGENLTWTLEDGTLTISGTGEMNDFSFSSVPWQKDSVKDVIITKGVTSIGNCAFWRCSSMIRN